MDETKQQIVCLIGGAATIGLIKGAEELYYTLHPEDANKFPYLKTINPLPPLDDWLVLAIPAVVTLAGVAMKKPKVKYFGLGGLLFQGANFIRIIVMRSGWMASGQMSFSNVPLRNATVRIAPIKEI
jgi:hypothetical protein